MLTANSSAKALFLATATPSPGSSNLCSTQACHTVTDMMGCLCSEDVNRIYSIKHSALKSHMFTVEFYLCLQKDLQQMFHYINLRRWILQHNKGLIEVTCKIMPSSSCPSSLSRSFSNGFSFSSGMENFPGLWCTDFNNLGQKYTVTEDRVYNILIIY